MSIDFSPMCFLFAGVVKYKFPEYKNDDEVRETLEFLFGKGAYSYDKNDKTNTNSKY